MGFHGVDLLRFAVKLDRLTTLGFASGVGYLVVLCPLHGVIFIVNIKYFSLL